ncbi:hypothetical protein QVD17_31509 [Tagetes erecta]|uniref:Transmembrane protein n=1 Tax=Tagetes erecta TaxID=13708 RepID=A0AAD8K4M8_TARER|nr:hypothetical protein QVD17_31509 [Tagetes erecta]
MNISLSSLRSSLVDAFFCSCGSLASRPLLLGFSICMIVFMVVECFVETPIVIGDDLYGHSLEFMLLGDDRLFSHGKGNDDNRV